jgi:prepilin-type N-terminal cleavage/methylation domain-containing protein
MKLPSNKKGFTLIELLIVVVIIGILAAIAIPRFGATRERAFVSAMQSDLRNLMTAQEQYYANPVSEYSYSDDLTVLGFVPSTGVDITISGADGTGFTADATHTATPITCSVTVTTDTTQESGRILCSDGTEA